MRICFRKMVGCRRSCLFVISTFFFLCFFTTVIPEDRSAEEMICEKVCETSESIIKRLEKRVEWHLSGHPKFSANFSEQKRFLSHHLNTANGLGNFLFITASVIALAPQAQRAAVFLKEHPHMNHFTNQFPVLSEGKVNVPADALKTKNFDVPEAGIYQPKLASRLSRHVADFLTISGYLQSWKYFDAMKDHIRWQFAFNKEVYNEALKQIRSCLRNFTDSGKVPKTIIGVHIRRGDILKKHFRDYGHKAASKDYIQQTMEKLNQTHSSPLFMIFSNDIKYCQLILRRMTNIVFVKSNPPEVDMALLTLMDHLILTVGTFGWWSAYLSEAKDIYYYGDWPNKGSKMFAEYKKEDYFLPTWISSV